MTAIRMAEARDAEGCVAILEALPEFFTPDTHEEVRAGLSGHRAWVAASGERVDGFVLVEVRYTSAAEITFAAVRPERQGSGVGTELVTTAIDVLAGEGIELVLVKTLDASSGYQPYVATRAFWERRGFRQVDCIDPLPGWQPGNPSAFYVRALNAS